MVMRVTDMVHQGSSPARMYEGGVPAEAILSPITATGPVNIEVIVHLLEIPQ